MKKPLLLEITAPEARIIDEKVDEATGDRVTRVEVKWQHAGVINGNGRRYRKELLQREVDKLLPMMEKGMVFGATYHPKGEAEVDDVSHIWESVEMKPDGSWLGIVKILPTDRGKNAQAIVRHGGRIGMSSRGYGTVTSKEEVIEGKTVKVDEVNDDFSLKSFGDFVLTPSVPDAGTMNILEAHFEKEDDASDSKEEKKMYKTLEELRAAQPELLKPLDDELTTTKAQAKELGDKIVTLETTVQEKTKLVEDLNGLVQGYVFKIREHISSMSELPGVIPEQDEEEPEEEPEEGKDKDMKKKKKKEGEEEEPEEKPEEEAKATEALKKDLETEKGLREKAETELKALKEAQEAKDNQDKVLKALKEALEKETPEYQKLIEAELIKDGKSVVEKLEEVAAKVTETKEKISTLKAQVKKEEIVKSGIDEKGRVANPETTAVPLTEEQILARWQSARTAGYKGSLEQYSKDVLHLNS